MVVRGSGHQRRLQKQRAMSRLAKRTGGRWTAEGLKRRSMKRRGQVLAVDLYRTQQLRNWVDLVVHRAVDERDV